MPQPQKYERSRDFTKQEAHKTDHAGINAELDNAATTIDALRVRQALLLNDQDQLRAKLIQRVNLSDGVIEDITSGVASGLRESVESAQSAARASLTFAEDATTQAAQALRSATQAQTTLDAAAITVAQAQAAMRDAGDVLGFVQQHAAATDPHAAAGYVKQQQIDSSLADHQQAADPHAQYINQQRGDVRYAPLASPALTGTPTAPTATAGTNTTQIATTAFANALSLPVGSLIYYAGSVAPAGYLEANGALLSRTTYAKLFAAIGIIYNAGDGSTTFGLPDLRGEFIRGWDNGRGIDAGRLVGSWQGDLMRKHDHFIPTPTEAPGSRAALVDDVGMRTFSNDILVSGPYYTYNYDTAGLLGHETRPRNMALLACIKF